MKYLFVLLFLVGCGGSDDKTNKEILPPIITVSDRLHVASWYSLPYWDHNGFPKYSGGLSTYTAKHIPVAVKGGSVDYYTFSDNSGGSLDIYIADTDGNKTLIRTIDGVIDPHDNAVVNYWDGYIWVIAAARGNSRIGHSYRSKNKNDISDFVKIDSGFWAYPHLWKKALLYTVYDSDNTRELYSKNNDCDNKLVEGGHYNISYDDGKYIHMVYNWHQDKNLDKRTNLYYMRSIDGCVWTDKDDNILNLPLSEFDNQTLIHETVDQYTYLKDISVVNGKVSILVVVSNSFYPDEGQRFLHKFTLDSDAIITEVGHNYNTGAFCDGYIVTPTFGDFGYAGGNLELFDLDGHLLHDLGREHQYNYARKVFNGNGCYVSEAPSSVVNKGAYIRRMDVN